LEKLRRESNEIDTWKSPYKAIVSVLMLKEGWDVRNVTVIVGLRAYAAASNILPEQTLGRGLRCMYFGSDQRETVSVMGTPAFMDFVESIQNEGVTFERVPMGATAVARAKTRSSSRSTPRTKTRTLTRSTLPSRALRAASTASSRTSASLTRRPSATSACV
jgi:type III restriction enzyme